MLNGTYTNWRYGEGNLNNPAALAIQHTSDILISAYQDHVPRIEFDGSAGIQISNVTRIEITGFEIQGRNYEITYEEAISMSY